MNLLLFIVIIKLLLLKQNANVNKKKIRFNSIEQLLLQEVILLDFMKSKKEKVNPISKRLIHRQHTGILSRMEF